MPMISYHIFILLLIQNVFSSFVSSEVDKSFYENRLLNISSVKIKEFSVLNSFKYSQHIHVDYDDNESILTKFSHNFIKLVKVLQKIQKCENLKNNSDLLISKI